VRKSALMSARLVAAPECLGYAALMRKGRFSSRAGSDLSTEDSSSSSVRPQAEWNLFSRMCRYALEAGAWLETSVARKSRDIFLLGLRR